MTTGSTREELAGAVLAGGESSRMGQPKHTVVLPDGRTMLEAVLDALRPVCALVVTLSDFEVSPGIAAIPDLRSCSGPLGGLEALLASGLADEYLVCTCDQPLITTETLAQLAASDQGIRVFRLPGEELPEPFPMYVRAGALRVVRARLDAGQHSMQGFIETAGACLIDADESTAKLLVNINTPEDLERAFPS